MGHIKPPRKNLNPVATALSFNYTIADTRLAIFLAPLSPHGISDPISKALCSAYYWAFPNVQLQRRHFTKNVDVLRNYYTKKGLCQYNVSLSGNRKIKQMRRDHLTSSLTLMKTYGCLENHTQQLEKSIGRELVSTRILHKCWNGPGKAQDSSSLPLDASDQQEM